MTERGDGISSHNSVHAAPGSPERAREMLRQAAEDTEYLLAERNRLLNKFPEQCVAIYRRSVVARGRNMEAILRQLAAKGIDPGSATVDLLTDKTRRLIL